jgi:hypothetical protein
MKFGEFMAKAYYSIVRRHPAEQVWATIRPFDHYGWAGVKGETTIEEGRKGYQVVGIRCVIVGSSRRRRAID